MRRVGGLWWAWQVALAIDQVWRLQAYSAPALQAWGSPQVTGQQRPQLPLTWEGRQGRLSANLPAELSAFCAQMRDGGPEWPGDLSRGAQPSQALKTPFPKPTLATAPGSCVACTWT